MSINCLSLPANNKQNDRLRRGRDSNLELYRIIVMILIIAHHYVVNSGLFDVLRDEPINVSSSIMILFGAWGKTGINCFVLITGYFMCRSSFSGDKLLKLYLQITLYAIIIYAIFCITGHEKFGTFHFLWKFWPVKTISDGFTSCFILFYLFIPFLNIFLKNLGKKEHLMLVILLLFVFSLLPTIPVIRMRFNYVGWFMILYIVGAFIRNYGIFKSIRHSSWGWITLILLILSCCSVMVMVILYKQKIIPQYAPYFFIADSNKILSLSLAVASFMYFKDLKITQSRLINAIGGVTFGVLLIHANSDTMRTWLWKETVDCVGNYQEDAIWTLGYATGCVLIIFFVCAGIDWLRSRLIEPHLNARVKGMIAPLYKKLNALISA